MRFSPTGIGCTNELRLLMRRAASPVKQMLEALRITRADVRQRKSQWLLADNTVGLRIDDFGGVRLDETVSTLIPERAPHNAYFVDADLDGRVPFVCDSIEWAGAEPAQIEIKRVKRWLHPRRDPAQPQTVVRWRLDLLRVVKVGGLLGIPAHRQLFVAPLCDPVYADVAGSAEGLVTFDFSSAAIQDRPKPKQYGHPIFADATLAALFNAVPAPTTLLVFTALDKNGAPATNVGAGYDTTAASVTTNGNVLSSRKLVAPATVLSLSDRTPLLFQPGTYGDNGSGGGTPRLIIESGTYVNDDVTFSGVGNRIDLGGVPTVPPTLTIQGAVPQGTSMTGQVLKDGGNPLLGGDWRTFISGQTTDLLANVGLRQTYEIRALLNTDATGSLTPTLRKLAVEEIGLTIDLSEVAELRLSNGYGIDLATLEGEIPRGAIVAIRDSAHDYHSAIENLLAAAQLGDYTFRVWVGAPPSVLAKQYWLHIDDVLPLGQMPHAPTYEIPVVSVLSKVRALLPKKSPGSSVSPDGDLAIGTYTTETGGGAPLFSHINEADADHSTYIRSVLDPVNQTYKATFPTPADLPGRRLYLDYWFMKDAAGGKTIDATIELRQSGVIIMQTIHANILGPDATTGLPTAGSVRLSDASVAAITDPTNLELWVTFNVGGAGASRRGILTWARFRTGDRRQGIAYVNQTGKDTYHDILVNQLEVDARLIGPELEDTTYLIGKVISEVNADEQPTSKSELEAVARAFGYGVLASQGKLKVVNMQDPGPIVAVVPLEEITFLSPPTPGIEDRIDDYVVPFNYNAAKAEFDDECEMVSAAGVLAFGDAEDGSADHRYAQEDAKWIQPQAVADYAVHARAIVKRFIDWFGCGRGRAHVKLPYMYPEAEPGDTLIFEQDLLVLRDPHTGAERRGRLWISAKIELADDPRCLGTQFLVGFRPYFDLLTPGTGETTRLGFVAPDFYELSATSDQAGAVTLIAKARGGQSVKLGWSTVDEATAIANAHASVAQVLDVDGIYRSGTAVTLLPDQTLIVAGFAYDRMNGAGAESALMTARVTFKYLPTIAIISARAVWRGNRLLIQTSGNSGVGSMKFATSIAAYPAPAAGASADGSDLIFDAGLFAYGDTVYVTMTPYSGAGATGNQGPVHRLKTALAYADGMFDDVTGKPKRNQAYTDAKFPLVAATADGLTADAGVLDSTGSEIRKSFHKVVHTDPDTADSVPDGAGKRVVTLNEGLALSQLGEQLAQAESIVMNGDFEFGMRYWRRDPASSAGDTVTIETGASKYSGGKTLHLFQNNSGDCYADQVDRLGDDSDSTAGNLVYIPADGSGLGWEVHGRAVAKKGSALEVGTLFIEVKQYDASQALLSTITVASLTLSTSYGEFAGGIALGSTTRFITVRLHLNGPSGSVNCYADDVKAWLIMPKLRCKVYNSAAQSINNNTDTQLTWDSEDHDIGNLHAPGSGQLKPPALIGPGFGLFLLIAQVEWAAGVTGYRQVRIIWNDGSGGQTQIAKVTCAPTPTIETTQIVTAYISRFAYDSAVPDFFEVLVKHTQGVALNVNGGVRVSEFSLIQLW